MSENGNIKFQPAAERPNAVAPPLVADRDVEIWNAVMWAYHVGGLTPAQGCCAMNIPAEQFARSYAIWHERVIGGKPLDPDRVAARHGQP